MEVREEEDVEDILKEEDLHLAEDEERRKTEEDESGSGGKGGSGNGGEGRCRKESRGGDGK